MTALMAAISTAPAPISLAVFAPELTSGDIILTILSTVVFSISAIRTRAMAKAMLRSSILSNLRLKLIKSTTTAANK